METIKKTGKWLAGSQKVRFGLVGAINTIVDFAVLNLLVDLCKVALIPANIVSTTTAMLVSFTLNKKAVFRDTRGNNTKQMVQFFAVTLVSIWLIQSTVLSFVYHLLSHDGLHSVIILNVAKIVGILVGLIWNYIWYSQVVFRKEDKK